MSFVSMIRTSKASTLLQVFGGSSPERTGREVRLAWGPRIAPFGVARSIPDPVVFLRFLGGPNSFLLWRIQLSQEKVKAP